MPNVFDDLSPVDVEKAADVEDRRVNYAELSWTI